MVTSIVELITPEKAQKYLATSKGNRNISQKFVDIYAQAMRKGEWMLNGVPIVFDEDGALIDGHHRLHAVIKAGVPIQSSVTRGVQETSFTTFDCGRNRNLGQLIGMQGVKNYTAVASAVATSYKLANGYIVGENHGMEKTAANTNTKMMEMYEEDKELYQKAGNFATSIRKNCNLLEISIIGGMTHHLVRRCGYDFELVANFFRQICSFETSPNVMCNLMRKKLCENKSAIKKLKRSVMVALIIKTWNFYATGTSKKRLVFDPAQEPYPNFIKITN